MKDLDLSTITPTKLVNINTIQGVVHGRPVIVERHSEHWEVRIRITIGGILFHCCTPTENEKEQFDRLLEECHSIMGNEYEQARNEIKRSDAFKAIFG